MRFVALLALGGLLGSCAGEGTSAGEEAFEGLRSFSEGEMRELVRHDLERFGKDGPPSALDDAAFRVLHHYRLHGFARAEVEARSGPEKVVFTIQEGDLYRLGELGFAGNLTFQDRELRAAIPRPLLGRSPPFSSQLVGLLVDEVLAAYRARGHVEAKVAAPELHFSDRRLEVDVVLRITEGPMYVITAFEGLEAHPDLARELAGLLGRPYTPDRIWELENAAARHFEERGHPFVRVRASARMDPSYGSVTVEFAIHPGPRARMADVHVTGEERARESFIRSRADLPIGEEYRRSALRRAEERLQATRLFRSVRVTPGPLQEESGEMTVDIKVDERAPGEVSLRGGYGTLEGVRGGADVAYENVLGGGETVRLGGTASRMGARADFELALPWVLGSEGRLGGDAYYEDRTFPSFDSTSYGSIGSFMYPIVERLSASAGARYAVVSTENVEPGVPPGDRLDFSYLAAFLTATWDHRDDPILPSRGFLVETRFEWAGEAFSPEIQFVNLGERAVVYVPLPWDLVFAATLQGGRIVPIDRTDEIPVSLRYFAGGTSTVRGFAPNSLGPQVGGEPTGGEVFAALQTEVRFPLWGDLHGAVLADRGGVWFRQADVNFDDTRSAVGVGLRYYTPAGALVADVAWNPNPREDEHPVEFHISIGFPF